MPRLVQEDRTDAGQLVAGRQDLCCWPLLVPQAAQVGGILHQLVGQLRRGKHVIHEAGGDRAPEDGIVLRRLRGLRHDHAAVLLHGAQADRSVGSRPGKEHAHGIVPLVMGERVEQAVDRQAGTAVALRRLHPQHASLDRQAGVGWNHVHMIRLHGRLVGRLGDAHARRLTQQLGEDARVVRVQVLDEHERHTAVGGHAREELLKRVQAAG